jgi:hypothetical protein
MSETTQNNKQSLRLDLREVAPLFKAPSNPHKRLEAELSQPGILWCSNAPGDILRAQKTLQSPKFLAVIGKEAMRASYRASMRGRMLSEEGEALFSDAFIRLNEQVCMSGGIPFPSSPDFQPSGLGGYVYITIRNHIKAAMTSYGFSYMERSLDEEDDSSRQLHERIPHDATLPANIESSEERNRLLDQATAILEEEDALTRAFLLHPHNRHVSSKHRLAYALVGAPHHMETWLFDEAESFGSRPLGSKKLEWLNHAHAYLDSWKEEGVSKRRSRAFVTWLLHGDSFSDADSYARKDTRHFQRARDTLRKNVSRGRSDIFYGLLLLLLTGRLRSSPTEQIYRHMLRQYLLKSAEIWSNRADFCTDNLEEVAEALCHWRREHADALDGKPALQELTAIMRSDHACYGDWERENQRKARHNLTKISKRLDFMESLQKELEMEPEEPKSSEK